ncbi:MAG: hypothetical protein EP330_22315 [Deltaproteobacteria bacterium]|nr:MAG: hypothetical protein EP330_22315 [Deltaproteobacteria bacterium]
MRRLSIVFLVGCGPRVLEPTTPSVHAFILEPACASAGCHLRPEPQQGLDYYDLDSTLATMVDQPPTVGLAAEAYDAIVVPGDPDGSFLIAKITSPGVEQGVAMPPTEWQLTDEAVEVIREWIAQLPDEEGL